MRGSHVSEAYVACTLLKHYIVTIVISWNLFMSNHAPIHSEAWTVANAKARLSELIERAQSEPQLITRNGTPSVIMVSVEEWNRKTARKGSLASFLMQSPLAGSALDLDRRDEVPRDLAL